MTKSFKAQDVVDAGLLVRRDGGGQYDRFRSRIMFPIFDLNGAVVGFAGRIFEPSVTRDTLHATRDEEPAKYVNTPQTPIYDKGKLLYGLNFARMDMRRNNRCLVVEGNVDVIMSHQAGAAHVVASSGTALTDGHLRIIKRYTDNLDLCFDADSAGTIATDRGVDLALAHGFNVGVVAINEPDVKDPADFVKKHGAGWAEYAVKSRPFLDFYFNKFRATLDLASALGKKQFSQKLLPLVASVGNRVEQAHWIGEVATALKMNEDAVRAELALIKARTPIAEVADSGSVVAAPTPLSLYEESLLALLLKHPPLARAISHDDEKFLSRTMRQYLGIVRPGEGDSADPVELRAQVMARLMALVAPTPAVASDALSSAKTESGVLPLEVAYLKSQEYWNDLKENELEGECRGLLYQIKKRTISSQLESLQFDIKAAEQDKDTARLATLIAEFSKLSRELGQSA